MKISTFAEDLNGVEVLRRRSLNTMSKKTNNLIPIIIGIFFIIGVVVLWGTWGDDNGQANESQYSASILSVVSDDRFDWGEVSMKDGDVSHEFELKNEGTESLRIEKVFTSCMCTVASIIDDSGKKRGEFGMPGHGGSSKTNIEIGAGESVTVNAVFDPAAHGPAAVGLAQRSIYIETNSSTLPKVELSLQAMVTK